MTERRYQTTHPWLTFEFADPGSGALTGRLVKAYALCREVAGTVLGADQAQRYLAKTVQATASIEGYLLTESQVAGLLDGRDDVVAPWQGYLRTAVQNVADVLQAVDADAQRSIGWRVTPEWLKAQNATILRDIADINRVVPGEYTRQQLPVGSAGQSAPPEDVPYLVDRLCDWLNAMLADIFDETPDKTLDAETRFRRAFCAAVLGQVYVAGMYPFGNGNIRTAIALEYAVLAHSPLIPPMSSGVLAVHYSHSAQRYHALLDTVRSTGDPVDFLQYAADGFVDQLNAQVDALRSGVGSG